MAGLAADLASSHGVGHSGSHHTVPMVGTSSEERRTSEDYRSSSVDCQHLRFEHTDCCDLGVEGPIEPEVCQNSCSARKAVRFASVTSTCSTACDSQSEPGALGLDRGASLAGQVWPLSQDPEGSRQVQVALEDAPSDEAQEALAKELHGHVCAAMRCPHANHVLQKCIALMRPEALQFILDELSAREGSVVQAAKHRYACRIVRHTLSKCPTSQTADLVEALLRDATVLACHSIGRATLELLLECGTEDQRYRLVRVVERNMHSIGLSVSGGAVVQTALSCAASEDKIWIARAVLQDPEVLVFMASQRHGHSAVVQVLKTLQDRELARAYQVLSQHADKLSSYKFGRIVAEHAASIGSQGA